MKIKNNMTIDQAIEKIESVHGVNVAFAPIREDFEYLSRVWPMDVGFRFVTAFGVFGWYEDIQDALYESLLIGGVQQEDLKVIFDF